jgi:glycosyltransferase involved in cell wall biosynthesis
MNRVAILVPGSLGDPTSRYHVPAQVDLVSRLSDEFDISIYSLIKIDGDDHPFRLGNATVRFVPARRTDRGITKVLSLALACYRDHRRVPYDAVHAFWALPGGLAAVLIGTCAGIPSLVSLQGGESAALPDLQYGNMLHTSSRLLTRWTCHRATGLAVLSKYQKEMLRSFNVHRDDIRTIPYGVSPTIFTRPIDRTSVAPFRFLHVANLTPVKDQFVLLKAFRRILDEVPATLRVVGPDHMEGALQRFVEEMGLGQSVEFLGHIHHADLPAHYARAHVLLQSSRYESQAVVVAEAAASGVAICGTRVGLVADMGDEMTVAVEPGDAEGLARETLALLRDPGRMRSMCDRAHSWALEHDNEWTAREYAGFYHDLIAAHNQ